MRMWMSPEEKEKLLALIAGCVIVCVYLFVSTMEYRGLL